MPDSAAEPPAPAGWAARAAGDQPDPEAEVTPAAARAESGSQPMAPERDRPERDRPGLPGLDRPVGPARDNRPMAAAAGRARLGCRPADAVACRQKCFRIAPPPAPPQGFRRSGAKSRRYGPSKPQGHGANGLGASLRRARLTIRLRQFQGSGPEGSGNGGHRTGSSALNPGWPMERLAYSDATNFPATRPCSRRLPWGGGPAPTSIRSGDARRACR